MRKGEVLAGQDRVQREVAALLQRVEQVQMEAIVSEAKNQEVDSLRRNRGKDLSTVT